MTPVHHAEFRHPTLVEVYDAECPWSRDDDFFCSVVDETPGARVLDLGCGTGRLAIGLAARGHRVTGVDPAAASLDAARVKPGAGAVTWMLGSTELLSEDAFDVAVMTSHVAQFFDGAGFARALADLHRALVPGGRLVFDTRDPDDRRWERWNPVESRHLVTLPDSRAVLVWSEVTSAALPDVAFTQHYELPDGSELTSDATLAFRPEREVRKALATAGFTVEHVYGGWARQPVGHEDGELLVVARA